MGYWLQRLIAVCVSIGISKRDLFECYYVDEIGEVIHEYGEMRRRAYEDETEEVDDGEFFGF